MPLVGKVVLWIAGLKSDNHDAVILAVEDLDVDSLLVDLYLETALTQKRPCPGKDLIERPDVFSTVQKTPPAL